MAILSTTTGIWVLAGIAVLALLATFFFATYKSFDTSKFHIFITVFSGFGILITFLFYYNLVELQQEQQDIVSIQQDGSLSSSIRIALADTIVKASPYIPLFIASIMPLINYQPGIDSKEAKATSYKVVISQKIFSIWKDYLTLDAYIVHDPQSYVCGFLQWANSKYLYEQWLVGRIDFSCNVNAFGDLLFQYALPIVEQTPEEYERVANEFVNSDDYKNMKCKKKR